MISECILRRGCLHLLRATTASLAIASTVPCHVHVRSGGWGSNIGMAEITKTVGPHSPVGHVVFGVVRDGNLDGLNGLLHVRRYFERRAKG